MILRASYLADVFLNQSGPGGLSHGAASETLGEGHRHEVQQPAADRSGERPAGYVLRVLIAYDDPVQLKLLKLHLDVLGYEVAISVDGFDAYDKARRFQPNAVVSDVMMPGLDGFGLCQTIRNDPRLSHIPVILVTAAQISLEDSHKATSAGASALVPSTPGFAEVKQALAAGLS